MKFVYFGNAFALIEVGMPVLARGINNGVIDQRGLCLFFVCQRFNLSWKDVEYSIPIFEREKVRKDFEYMFNPVHVIKACQERSRFKK